ncbi:hypothetical protein RhiirA4_470676 [Rhizophagus irregularis]|uniref:HAT C-terminal dimerisation domain-containing protein n=1 Tax=Rhizophagus irregularis TaxID=588596 RepID=A0A2I1H1P4_9GLOM|nr:hypothetical protein RhiirA4_470676 [Rhizophagus irregularis]
MSLLQYGFERKRIRDDSLQNDQVSDNEDNPNKDIKKPCIANSKTFKLKWLTEFSWLHYDENKKKMYSIREHANTEDHNDAEKLESNKEEIWDELLGVVAFGVMIDESTDITTTKHQDIYVSYVTKEGISKTPFVSDGASIRNFMAKLNLWLRRSIIILKIHVHEFNNYKKFKDPILKIKRLYEIRWITWYEAIKNICNSIPALIKIFKESKNNDGQVLYKYKVILPLLIQDYNDVFPNIIKLIQIAYCIPFSSVECERGFSRQNKIIKRIGTYLVTNTLDMLMRVSLEGPEARILTICAHIQFGVIKKA